MPAAPLPHEQLPHHWPLTVLVDDVRRFKDQRPALVARSSPEALRLLDELEASGLITCGWTTICSARTRLVPLSTCSSIAPGRGRH
jgi:hypothetical protein